MYSKVNTQTGVEVAGQWFAQHTAQVVPDGLEFTPPQKPGYFTKVQLPDSLRSWLLDLRLLRHIPLCYLVPDAALLPPESIRFFHVDRTWVDRMIDGVFCAGNTGTLDAAFGYTMLALVREALDDDLLELAKANLPPGHTGAFSWPSATGAITGMLIRSQLVRRWPEIVVEAWSAFQPGKPGAPAEGTTGVPTLRSEAISRDIYIALFAGVPTFLTIREPHVGVRFGVEPKIPTKSEPPYKVDKRTANGEGIPNQIVDIHFRDPQATRVLKVDELADLVKDQGGNKSARMVALHLEQRPYVQEFFAVDAKHPESRGSTEPPTVINSRKGRYITAAALIAHAARPAEPEKP